MAGKDYYAILGLGRGASEEEIKRAYRRLAREHHPDANGGDPEAEARFKEIAEAYAVLSDPEKRARYDHYGSEGADFDFGNFGGFGDIFDMFFGGGGGGGRPHPERGDDLRIDLELTLEEVFTGLEREVEINRIEGCPDCGGSGARTGTQPSNCPVCGGRGHVETMRQTPFGRLASRRPCDHCGGRGQVVNDPCPSCRGVGRLRRKRKITLKVPAGVGEGTRLRMAGEGEAGQLAGPPGDLYVFIHERKHARLKRDGSDLHLSQRIAFTQASLGAEIQVEGVDGAVTLRVPEGTQSGAVFPLRGHGLPHLRGHGRGDLLVHVQVEVPQKLSPEERELLERLAHLRGESVQGGEKGFFKKVKDAFRG